MSEPVREHVDMWEYLGVSPDDENYNPDEEILTCPKCGDEIKADAMELHEEVCIGEKKEKKT